MLAAGERIYEQLGQAHRGAVHRQRRSSASRRGGGTCARRSGAADDRLAHLNLLANAVLSLLRSTVGGLGVEPTLPAHLRAAHPPAHRGTRRARRERRSRRIRGGGPGRPRRPVRGRGAARARHPRAVDRFDHRGLRARPVPRHRRRAGAVKIRGAGCPATSSSGDPSSRKHADMRASRSPAPSSSVRIAQASRGRRSTDHRYRARGQGDAAQRDRSQQESRPASASTRPHHQQRSSFGGLEQHRLRVSRERVC